MKPARLVLISAILFPLLVASYFSLRGATYIQSGTGQDPLKINIPVHARGSNAALDLVVHGMRFNTFVELYCYEPLEITGQKFFVAGVNISSRRSETYPLALRQFYVIDTAGARYAAHADRLVYEEDLEQPFIIDDKGEGFLLPWENRTGDMVFILPYNAIPVRLGLSDPSGDIDLDLRPS